MTPTPTHPTAWARPAPASGPTAAAIAAVSAPGENEPEHVRVPGSVSRKQGGKQRHRPDAVVEEGLAAAAEREERISPAVLQQQRGQRQPEGEEGGPGRAVQHCGGHEHAGADDQAHVRGRPGALGYGAPPGRQVGAAEPDHQRVGGQAARGVEREPVGHVGEAERAELSGPQRVDHVDADREVGQAGYHLVRDTPAETADHMAPQSLDTRRYRTQRPSLSHPGMGTCLSCHACRLCGRPRR